MVCAPIATLTLIGSLVGGANAANLLIDPGFEDPSNMQALSTTVTNLNANQGKWGTEGGSVSASLNSVVPFETSMHDIGLGSNHNQTFQFTNLSAYASDIATGNATIDISAMYNTGGPHNATAYISAQFYTASGWGSTVGSTIGNSLSLDSDASTWEEISAAGIIPAGAVWMSTQVAYINNTMDGEEGFVDNASLMISVPEPSSTLLLGLGAIGALMRRRR